ncbi:MAG: DUF5686 family protein [Flavobacteriales bacterium]|nr:DUF5686 family protein [Flavobacteriales bacterium]
MKSKKVLFSILFIFLLSSLFGQKTKVYGKIIDSKTKEPIAFATVSFQGTKTGAYSDFDGNYSLESYYSSDSLVVSFVGYNPKVIAIKRDVAQEINIDLKAADAILEVFEVEGSKKDENPAETIMKRVIANKKINNRAKLDAYEYEVYNKIEFDLNNLDEKFMNRKVFQKFDFVFNMIDSTDEKPYLPIFIVESISDYYYNQKPELKKEVIKATKVSGPENESISQYLGDMYQNANIYDNTVFIFGRQFISPLNNTMLLHYKVYLTDSAYIDNNWCYKIEFIPRKKSDLAFEGEMWINDTTYAVKVFDAEIAGDANINYINKYRLKQTFEQVEDEVWMMVLDQTIADINPLANEKQKGFYGRKTTSYKDFVINKPRDEDFFKNDLVVADSAREKTAEFWDERRHIKLSEKENKIYQMIDTMKDLPVIKTYIDVIQTLATGYKILGPIEVGPYSSIYSFNPIEGHRVSLGIQTSNAFSKRIMFNVNAGYGFTDNLWKYRFETKFFVTKEKTPRRIMELKYMNDNTQFDRDFFEPYNQNLISSFFRRNPYNKLVNVEGPRIKYFHEWKEGFSNTIGIQSYNLESLGNILSFQKSGNNTTSSIASLDNTEVIFGMRYAKNEKFVSGEFNRISLGSISPIWELKANIGISNSIYGNYNYQKVKLNVTDKLYWGYIGMTKYSLEAGKLWGTVPYPLLFVHQGNETWGYTNDYNAMNIGEFMSDQYVSLSIDHYFGGLFLNRIPLLRKLKWRELVTGKIIYGQLDTRHLSELDLPKFSTSLTSKPYAEVSAGVENIFKILRVEGIWRLTYLDNNVQQANVLSFGVRAKLQFEF